MQAISVDIDADVDIAIDVYFSVIWWLWWCLCWCEVDNGGYFDDDVREAVERDFQKKLGFGPSQVSGQSQCLTKFSKTFSLQLWCRVRPSETKSLLFPQIKFNGFPCVWKLMLMRRGWWKAWGKEGTEAVQSSNRVALMCAFFFTIVCFVLTSSEFHSHHQIAFEEKHFSASTSGSREILGHVLCAVRNIIVWCWWLGSMSNILYFVFTLFAL